MKKYYLCGISFQHELGETDEIGIYDSIEELKSKHYCWEECGIVELNVENDNDPKDWKSFIWIVPQNLKWGNIKTDQEANRESDR